MRLALTVAFSFAAAAAVRAGSDPAPVHGIPRILSVDIPANRNFYAGQTIHGSVVTTPNVDYVEARIDYRNSPLHRDGAGRFSLDYTIPWWLPPWLRHAWTLQFVARSVDGVEVKEEIPIRVH